MGQTISSYFTTQEEYEALGAVLQGNGEFTKKLYSILSRNTGNVFFSPVIIHAILSLVYQGARGETEQVLTQTLNVPDATVAAKGYKVLMSRLTSMKNVTLLMANKILLQDNVLEQNFKKVAVKQFLAEVDRVDFSQPASVTASVNSWVEKKTKNKIKDLMTPDDIQNDTSLILVNAIYFKGKWAKPFKTTNTRTQMFYINDHDTINVQMMHVEKDCFYKRDDTLGSQILELPYINKDVSLIVILPNERNGIAALEKKLAAVDLTRITENMFKSKVKVDLPKFKIEQTIDLNGPLTELGLGVMFGDDADFSGVTKSLHLRVEKVLQKSCIEVSEEGTEAAAADAADVDLICEVLPLSRLYKSCHILISQGQAANLLAPLFKLVIKEKGPNFLHGMWLRSGLRLSDFMPDSQVDAFVKDNQFEFLVGGDGPVGQNQTSYEQIQAKLLEFLRAKTSFDDTVNWITANVGDRVKECQFIKALATAIFMDSISSNLELVPETLSAHNNLLLKYIDNNATYELQCLYALQALIHKLGHPQGLLLSICDKLYELGTFSQEGLIAWENSSDPAEQEGKGVALKQLICFFTQMKENDEEEYGSSTSDEA